MNDRRYHRQISVPELGAKGQKTLHNSSIVVIGGGGLGSHIADLLVRMGCGTLTIIDDDTVDLTNLHRTALFTEKDIGQPKAYVLEQKLSTINTASTITGIEERIDAQSIQSFTKTADLLMDGTDNMHTRFLINDSAVKYRVPWVYTGVQSTVAMIMGIIPKQTPCLHCLTSVYHDTQEPLPILGMLPATAASIACGEAMKLLLHQQPSGLIMYDIWNQQFDRLTVQRNTTCPCCAKDQFTSLKKE